MHKKLYQRGNLLLITLITKSKGKTTSNDFIITPGWTIPNSVSRDKFDWWRWYTVMMMMMIIDKVCKEGAKFTRTARPMRSIGVPGVSYSTSLDQGSLTCSLFWSISISLGPLLKYLVLDFYICCVKPLLSWYTGQRVIWVSHAFTFFSLVLLLLPVSL